MGHLDFVTTLIIVAVIVYAIVKQFMAKPVRRSGFVIFPLLALVEACESYRKAAVTQQQLLECAAMIALALAAAAVQAINTEIFYQDNQLYMRSKIIAVVTWAAYFLARVGLRLVFPKTGEWIIWLGIAVIFGARSVILMMKYPEITQALSRRSGRHRRRI